MPQTPPCSLHATWPGRLSRLTSVFLSHADFDHYRGLLHPLRHFTVDAIFPRAGGPKTEEGDAREAILRTWNIPHAVPRTSDWNRLDHDLILEVLHPNDKWINAVKEQQRLPGPAPA